VLVGFLVSRKPAFKAIGVALGSVALLGILVLAMAIGRSGVDAVTDIDLESLNETRTALGETAASGFALDVDTSTTSDALSYLPIATIRFLLGPSPWQFTGARQLPAVGDAIVWWALTPAFLVGLTRVWRVDPP
jgi:hypothetical protein